MAQILSILTDLLNQLIPRESLAELFPLLLRFLLAVAIALLLGQITPKIIESLVRILSPEPVFEIYQTLVTPVQSLFRTVASFVFLEVAWNVWQDYRLVYNFTQPFLGLATAISMAWFISRVFRQFFRKYGINVLNPQGKGSDEIAMVLETIVNIIIGLVAAVAFAQSQNFNLIGLVG